MVTNPRWNKDALEWFRAMRESDREVMIPEITDYELRRNLILEEMEASIQRLDKLKALLIYLPIDTRAMLQAAQFWADSRSRHTPTGHPKELDGDAILAAQAKQAGAIVVTDNVGHLSQFVETKKWSEMGFGYDD
ncbi:MAG: PIN domain-containing protein, partial [Planctomycetes bacterium]|nr:PIN domain-containing protein [Planctomycetota bacterium]